MVNMFKYLKEYFIEYIEDNSLEFFVFMIMCLAMFASGFILMMLFIWKMIFRIIF